MRLNSLLEQELKSQNYLQREIGTAKNFVYAIADLNERKALILDPHHGVDRFLKELLDADFNIAGVALTHTHWDHINGLEQFYSYLNQENLPLWVHPLEFKRLSKKHLKGFAPQLLSGIKTIPEIMMGHTAVTVLHTPGHSAGECCFYVPETASHPPLLFTGDTLFIRDCGRTDLETGSNKEMFESLQKLKQYPKETLILPGHHYQTECTSTLAKELETNPALRVQSVLELQQLP